MDSTNRVGSSPTHFNYYEITKATVTSVALMALSVGVMKGIERYAKRTITPFQKNIAGVLLTTVYMVAAAHFCGPFTKKDDLPPSSLERRSGDQEGVVVSQRVQLTVFRNPIDLTHVNSRKMLLVLRAFEQAIIRNGSRAIGCPIPLGGRVILILVDISTREKQARALKLCQQWKRFFREGKRGVLPPIQNESPPPLSIEYRSENIVALHPRRKGSKQVRFSAPQALLRKSPIDLTSVNPREIQNVLDGFREAIRMNGVRFVDCRVPLAGRMYWIHADISSPLKQQRALQACDYWESLILGNQQSEHALSLEEPLKTPDWVAFNSYVQQHCFGINPMRAKEKALRGLQLIQKLHRNEPVEQDNLEEKLSDACWGLMLSAITRGQAFVEGTFDLTDPGHRLFHFFMPILYGRSSSHYKKRVIPVTEGYWKGYGHFGYDIGRDGQNDLPAYKRTVMLGRIITRDGTDRTYLKMENWGANLNFFSDWRAVTSAHQVAIHSVEFIESQAKRNAPSVFGEVGGGLNMRKEHMLGADKKRCQTLYQKICEAMEIRDRSIDIDEFGFQDVVPLLREALNHHTIQGSELHEEIASFLRELEGRYDNLHYRKGDEVNLGASILFLDSAAPKERLDGSFVLVDPLSV